MATITHIHSRYPNGKFILADFDLNQCQELVFEIHGDGFGKAGGSLTAFFRDNLNPPIQFPFDGQDLSMEWSSKLILVTVRKHIMQNYSTGNWEFDIQVNPASGASSNRKPLKFRVERRLNRGNWQSIEPNRLTVRKRKLAELQNALGSTSGTVIKDGYVVRNWAGERRFDWASASKTVLAMVGWWTFQSAQWNWSDTVGKILGNDFPDVWEPDTAFNPAGKDKQIQMSQLANMLSGFTRKAAPGESWAYNDYGVMLFARLLFEKIHGGGRGNNQTANAFLKHHFQLPPLFQKDADNFHTPYRVYTSPSDFARFGYLVATYGHGTTLRKSSVKSMLSKGFSATLPVDGDGSRIFYRYRNKFFNVEQALWSYSGNIGDSHIEPNRPCGNCYGYFWWLGDALGAAKALGPHAAAAKGKDNAVLLVFPEWRYVIAANGNWGKIGSAQWRKCMQIIRDSV